MTDPVLSKMSAMNDFEANSNTVISNDVTVFRRSKVEVASTIKLLRGPGSLKMELFLFVLRSIMVIVWS